MVNKKEMINGKKKFDGFAVASFVFGIISLVGASITWLLIRYLRNILFVYFIWFFILLSVITIFPLIILSFFNNPASDDFDYSYESQVEPFWSLQIRRYFDWSGRYFSNGLISLDPLVYNNYLLFRLIPIVLIFAFIFSIHIFVNKCAIFYRY